MTPDEIAERLGRKQPPRPAPGHRARRRAWRAMLRAAHKREIPQLRADVARARGAKPSTREIFQFRTFLRTEPTA